MGSYITTSRTSVSSKSTSMPKKPATFSPYAKTMYPTKSEVSEILELISEIASLEKDLKETAELITEKRNNLIELAKDLSPEVKDTLKSMGVSIDEAKTLDELLDEDKSFRKINKIYKNREDR